MLFAIGTNWDDALVDELSGFPVTELSGGIPQSFIGSSQLDVRGYAASRAATERHIRKIHDRGLAFNCRMDATCLGKLESDPHFKSKMKTCLSWVRDMGIRRVTVSSHAILAILRANAPGLQITLSGAAGTAGAARAHAIGQVNGHELLIDPNKNRDFGYLETLERHARCELALVVNQACLYQCAYGQYHANSNSHFTQDTGAGGDFGSGPAARYCTVRCTLARLRDPAHWLRARWIRPEDLGTYEALGFTKFVLASHDKDCAWIRRALTAYCGRRYDGNLLDLLHTPDHTCGTSSDNAQGSAYADTFIDNRGLEDFLASFKARDCMVECGACDHCATVAAKTVRRNAERDAADITAAEAYLSAIFGGRTNPPQQASGAAHQTPNRVGA